MAVTLTQFINIVGEDVLERVNQEEVERILKEALDDVVDEIRSITTRKYDLTTASSYELETIDDCVIEQAKYIISTMGSIGNMSGYDPVANTFVSREEIEKRVVSVKVKKKLRQTRWNYRGLW